MSRRPHGYLSDWIIGAENGDWLTQLRQRLCKRVGMRGHVAPGGNPTLTLNLRKIAQEGVERISWIAMVPEMIPPPFQM